MYICTSFRQFSPVENKIKNECGKENGVRIYSVTLPERSIHYPFSHAVNRDNIDLWPSSITLWHDLCLSMRPICHDSVFKFKHIIFHQKNKLVRNALTS